MTPAECLELLKRCLADGSFHHATYRNQGTLWEGLHIYVKSNGVGSFRGYSHLTMISKDEPAELEAAYQLTRGTGISLGAHGEE
jgi:hypothetical protein